MKITLLGNCQTKALTWYIQQLDQRFDVKWIWTDIGMDDWAKKQKFRGKSIPTISSTQHAKDILNDSGYIIYQPIRPSRIPDFNYEDIQRYGNSAKLISIGCFYCQKPDEEIIDKKIYQEKTGLIGMKERAKEFQLDIPPHKIIEKYGVDKVATENAYHPRALYFLELVRQICTEISWNYYSDEQYNKYLKEGYPFG